MGRPLRNRFSRRERQIMDAIYEIGEATAADVVAQLDEPDAYDSVRVTLAILERKGHLRHRQEGNRNVYFPTVSRERAMRSEMQHLVRTFFGGSATEAVLAFLDQSKHRLTDVELEEIASWIEERREEEA